MAVVGDLADLAEHFLADAEGRALAREAARPAPCAACASRRRAAAVRPPRRPPAPPRPRLRSPASAASAPLASAASAASAPGGPASSAPLRRRRRRRSFQRPLGLRGRTGLSGRRGLRGRRGFRGGAGFAAAGGVRLPGENPGLAVADIVPRQAWNAVADVVARLLFPLVVVSARRGGGRRRGSVSPRTGSSSPAATLLRRGRGSLRSAGGPRFMGLGCLLGRSVRRLERAALVGRSSRRVRRRGWYFRGYSSAPRATAHADGGETCSRSLQRPPAVQCGEGAGTITYPGRLRESLPHDGQVLVGPPAPIDAEAPPLARLWALTWPASRSATSTNARAIGLLGAA